MRVSAIEVSFAVPVVISNEQECRLTDLIDEIARANTPDGCVHWLSSMGSKPHLSPTDAHFLGEPGLADDSVSGEPWFDDSVLHFGTHCRERSP